jgi:hopene-associated glycosyltransferase HpnB
VKTASATKILGLVALGIWAGLRWTRGNFWRIAEKPMARDLPDQAPRVVAVVPARNEEAAVSMAVASLAEQHYPGDFHIVLVDDGSEDGTVLAARCAAPPEMLTILSGAHLPAGWTGKLWAVSQGIREAERFAPDYLLLTDADILHSPEGLRLLVAEAEHSGRDLVSWMVTLRCESLAERALIPAFVFFFFLLYPPAWVSNPRRKIAAAAGGCILIRRQMLERIGGVATVRGELIDDCALAQAVKNAGGRVWLGHTRQTRSIREYRTFREIGRMISRTAFTQLRYSPLLLLGTVLGLSVVFLAPPLTALRGNPYGAAAWVLMSATYAPVVSAYRRSLLWTPLLPLVAVFYLAATVHSAWAYWRGSGGMWKGRPQATRRLSR